MKAKLSIYILPIVLSAFLFYSFSTSDEPAETFTGTLGSNTLNMEPYFASQSLTGDNASLLFDNGALVNSVAILNGCNVSVLRAPLSVFGFGSNTAAFIFMADDFTVPAGGWVIDSLETFTYQTGSTTTSTITSMTVQIWSGVPDSAGSSVVFGDTSTNRLSSSTYACIYRGTDSLTTNRPVMKNVAAIGANLPAGRYFIQVSYLGSLASGPWSPPVSINGQLATGDARQRIAGVWGPAVSGPSAPQGLPFILRGTAGCPGPLQPVLEIDNFEINGVPQPPGTLTCGGRLEVTHHNDVATFDITITDDGQPAGTVTVLAPVVNLTPPDCKNITYTYNGAPAVFPIVSNNPVILGVRIARIDGNLCVGSVEFRAHDDCPFQNTASCGINLDNPLPVELSTFTSNVTGNDVNLSWSTSTETNNSGFDIERRISNSTWNKVGFVEGSGNSITPVSYSFTERNLNSGTYSYRLKQIDFNGNFEYFNLSNEVNIGTPVEFSLNQNYPNPFNPSTKIEFALPKDGFVSLAIFDNSGREVSRLVNENRSSGYYAVSFNGSGLSSGIYFYRLEVKGSDNFVQVRKMVLVK